MSSRGVCPARQKTLFVVAFVTLTVMAQGLIVSRKPIQRGLRCSPPGGIGGATILWARGKGQKEWARLQEIPEGGAKTARKARFRSANPAERVGRGGMTSYSDDFAEGDEAARVAADIVSYDTYDAFKEDYGVAGSTLREVSIDYNFPLEFLISSACDLGVTPPVNCDKKLCEMLNGDQIFAVVEALTTLDPAEARDRFVDKCLEEIADEFHVSVARIFEICGELNLNIAMGIRTHLSVQEYNAIADELEQETGLGKRPVEARLGCENASTQVSPRSQGAPPV